jgi:hypothetical protein
LTVAVEAEAKPNKKKQHAGGVSFRGWRKVLKRKERKKERRNCLALGGRYRRHAGCTHLNLDNM